MRPQSVGCVPTYSAGRQPIAVRHGDEQVFDTDGVFFDKAELPETMVAGATLRLGKPTADGLRGGSGHLARLRLRLLGRLPWRHYVARLMPTSATACACLSFSSSPDGAEAEDGSIWITLTSR
jgi:hypothetical protein